VITVLRLGHRPARDKRVTTHVALAARALGADAILVSTKDTALEKSVRDVVRRFGGAFRIETGVPWLRTVKGWKGQTVHLTMYGEPVEKVSPQLRIENLLVVVGAEKVPRALYDLVDWNVAIGNQPHSEVAALAVFLDRVLGGASMHREFSGRLRIEPSARGKDVIESGP
jgi:tRNA (cytidine56-2'-O)-methyltransferase